MKNVNNVHYHISDIDYGMNVAAAATLIFIIILYSYSSVYTKKNIQTSSKGKNGTNTGEEERFFIGSFEDDNRVWLK
jgi:hypothetical protein